MQSINNQTINHHLNLFTHFSDNEKYIENNLSRALALCLMKDELFFNEFLRQVMKEEYEFIFKLSEDIPPAVVNLQESIENIEGEYEKIYAIAIGPNELEDFTNKFHTLTSDINNYSPITDITIKIKEYLFIIEVKREHVDFVKQLHEQIEKYKHVNSFTGQVIPLSFSWERVVRLMENVKTLKKLFNNNNDFYITSFINLIQLRFISWFPTKPLSLIKFNSDDDTIERRSMERRLFHAFSLLSENDRKYFSDRLSITCNFPWAVEIIPQFGKNEELLYISIYPGNTKGQGHHVYKKDLNWLDKKTITINGKEFKLDYAFEVKFCHFNRFVSQILYTKDSFKKFFHTKENFGKSGKWNKTKWKDLEVLLDEHFDFDWRKKCKWEENFLNTDRSYLTMSLGFEVSALIPYSYLQEIDKNEKGLDSLKDFLQSTKPAFEKLLD